MIVYLCVPLAFGLLLFYSAQDLVPQTGAPPVDRTASHPFDISDDTGNDTELNDSIVDRAATASTPITHPLRVDPVGFNDVVPMVFRDVEANGPTGYRGVGSETPGSPPTANGGIDPATPVDSDPPWIQSRVTALSNIARGAEPAPDENGDAVEEPCVILGTSAELAGPCRTDGRRLVEITVEYAGVDPDWELFFPGVPKSFPLTGSPQTEQVLLFNLFEPAVEIRETIPIAEPYPFGPAFTQRVVCQENVPVNVVQCERGTCEIQDVQVVGMECLQGGVVAVDVAITHTNVRPTFIPVEADFNGGSTFLYLETSPQVERLYVPGDGSEFSIELKLRGDFLEVECGTNAVNLATLPVCSAPCQLTGFEPVAMSACVDGMVDVTFEVSATGATGTWFGVELQDRSVSDFFLYTNTPMQAVLRVPGDGSSINVVAGQVIPTVFPFSDYNTNCAVLAENIITVRECFVLPTPELPPTPDLTSCGIQDVRVLGMNCQQGGIVAVEVEITHTNLPPFIPLEVGFSGFVTSFPMPSSPHVETLYMPGDGRALSLALTVRIGSQVLCETNVANVAALPDCLSPCRLTAFEPVSISACEDGMVDVTFEISATNATGTFFRVERTDRTVGDFFLYTNTPMQAVLRMPADGSSISVLAGQVVQTAPEVFSEYNTDCALGALDILTLPDCNPVATFTCSTNPPTFTQTATMPPPSRTFPFTDLPGFYTTANTITIEQGVPDPGFILTANGQDSLLLCDEDDPAPFTVFSEGAAAGLMPLAYVITDEADQVLRIRTNNTINPSLLPLGTSRIYAVVSTGDFADLTGSTIDELSPLPCGRSANFITVDRTICPREISGVVWLDLNNDGEPDENLAQVGIADIPVRILDEAGVVVAVVTSDSSGAYTSPELPSGNYAVRVDSTDLFEMQPVLDTTPLSYVVDLGGSATPEAADFGFVPPPTVAILESFSVTPTFSGAELSWIIGFEMDHLGYKVHRSATPDGPQVPVDGRLILADGSHRYNASDANGDAGSFYWLESINSDLEPEFFGPFQAPGTSSEIIDDLQLVIVHHVPFTVHARTRRMLVKGLPEDATLVIPDTAKHAALSGESEAAEYIQDLRVDDQVRGE